MTAAMCAQMFQGVVESPRDFVAAAGTEGVKHISDDGNAGVQMNAVPGQALGITAAVKVFMML